MKRFNLILVLVLIVTFNTNGQDSIPYTAGHLMFGGSIYMDSKKVEIQTLAGKEISTHFEKNFSTDFHLGYFVFNNIAAGIKVDLSFNRISFESGAIQHIDIFLIEPFMRYYTPFGLFGEGSIGYGFYKFRLRGISGDDQVKNAWSLGIGYNLFINKNIAIESVLSYDVLKNTEIVDDHAIKNNGLCIKLGIQLYLNLSKTRTPK